MSFSNRKSRLNGTRTLYAISVKYLVQKEIAAPNITPQRRGHEMYFCCTRSVFYDTCFPVFISTLTDCVTTVSCATRKGNYLCSVYYYLRLLPIRSASMHVEGVDQGLVSLINRCLYISYTYLIVVSRSEDGSHPNDGRSSHDLHGMLHDTEKFLLPE